MINGNVRHSFESTRTTLRIVVALGAPAAEWLLQSESTEYTDTVSHFLFTIHTTKTPRPIRPATLNWERLTYVEEEDRGDVSRLLGTG
jgi:hypothetical protein